MSRELRGWQRAAERSRQRGRAVDVRSKCGVDGEVQGRRDASLLLSLSHGQARLSAAAENRERCLHQQDTNRHASSLAMWLPRAHGTPPNPVLARIGVLGSMALCPGPMAQEDRSLCWTGAMQDADFREHLFYELR